MAGPHARRAIGAETVRKAISYQLNGSNQRNRVTVHYRLIEITDGELQRQLLHGLSETLKQPFLPLLHESLISLRRAGAQAIFTYGAIQVAKHIN